MIVFSDDFQSYSDSTPADFSTGAANWVSVSGAGRIRTTPPQIFDKKVWQASAPGTSIRSTPIAIDANTEYLFTASLGIDVSNGDRKAVFEYDLRVGTNFASARSLWGSLQTELVRGGSPQPATPIVRRPFSTGALTSGEKLFVVFRRLEGDGWVCVSETSIYKGGIVKVDGSPDIEYPTLYAWYDATTVTTSRISRWNDSSKNDRHLDRTRSEVSKPSKATVGGVPTVAFDGSSQIWAMPSKFGTMAGPKTVFVLAQISSPGHVGYLFDSTTVRGRNAVHAGSAVSGHEDKWVYFLGSHVNRGPSVDYGQMDVHCFVMGTRFVDHWINGHPQGSHVAMSFDGQIDALIGLMIGGRYNFQNQLAGHIADILFYDQILCDAQRRAIEGHLLQKLGRDHSPAAPGSDASFSDDAESQVFRSPNDQEPYIRIPALICTTSGVLLALAERRMDGRHDQRRNHILIRRSTNGGRSWEPARVVVDFGQDFHANNPVAVQVRSGANKGRIFLTVTRLVRNYGNGGDNDDDHGVGTNKPFCGRHYLTHSDDDGLTWTTPREFSRLVRTDSSKKVVAGPGAGIQIRWGRFRDRIILPFSEDEGIFAVWSDDGGDTWERGGLGPHFGRELEIAELSPRAGETVLLASVRNKGDRSLQESLDGGQTWIPRTELPLRDVSCHGSTISFSFKGDGEVSRLLHSAPQSPNCDGVPVDRRVARKCGTVFISNDEGATWRTHHDFLHPSEEYFFYSSMCRLPNDRVGVLFEAGGDVDNRVGPIIFKSFPITRID